MLDLWCRAVCAQPLILPVGPSYNLNRSQRPNPSPRLQVHVRNGTRLFSFMLLWASAFFVISLTRRANIFGIVLNPAYMLSAVLGGYGCLTLHSGLVAISIVAELAIFCIFLAFVLLNYIGGVRAGIADAWVVLAFFLPGLVVDLLISLGCVPTLLCLRAADAAERAVANGSEASMPSVLGVSGEGGDTGSADVDDPAVAAVHQYRCPITLEVMKDPVLAADGHSYERSALATWLSTHRTSPVTGARLEHVNMTPNHQLRSLIQEAAAATATAIPTSSAV